MTRPASDLSLRTSPAARPTLASLLLRASLVAALILAGLALYGLGPGGGFYIKMARAPLAPQDAAPYYRESLLHVVLAHALGLTGALQFRLFVLGFWWSGVAALLFALRLAHLHLALVALVLLTHPAAMIVHSWACHPDAPVFLLTALLLLVRRPAIVAPLAFVMALANLAMTAVVAVSLALLWLARHDRLRALATCAGAALGAAACKLTLALAGVHLARDRLTIAAQQDPSTLLTRWLSPGWPVVYTLHFAHLLWLPALYLTLRSVDRPLARALLATQALALLAATFAEDTTRIFALLAWAPLVFCLCRALAHLEHTRDRFHLRPLVALAVLVSLLAPKCFAWKGELRTLDDARTYRRAHLF